MQQPQGHFQIHGGRMKKASVGRISVGTHNSSSQVVPPTANDANSIYVHPFSTNQQSNKIPPEFIGGGGSLDDTTHNTSMVSRDMAFQQSKMQLFNRNSLLPKIAASAAGSLIQYNSQQQ